MASSIIDGLFLNPGGLTFLAFLLPLILLYLIKPKPMRRAIPSLMFILKDVGRNRMNRAFRNFLTDILLLIQFLAILLATLSIAQPFINVPQSFMVQDAVLVIDVSASTRVNDRFSEIKSEALDSLASQNTIILAQSFSEVVLDGGTAARAKRIIKDLRPKDTTTNLADALRLANQYAGPNTNVIILSDFLPSEGSLDIQAALEALESKGALVTPHVVGKPVNNVGITDLSVRDTNSKLWIKNFHDRPTEVTLSIGGIEQAVLLAKRETKEIDFATPEGVTEIKIEEKDDFMTDNTVRISTPTDNQVDILVITNNKKEFEDSNLILALELIEKNFPITINVEYAVPPKVPDLNHDIYIFYDVTSEFLLPGVVKDLRDRVTDGAGLVFMAQNNLFSFDLLGMLPVDYVGQGENAEVRASAENLLTKDISFGQLRGYDIVSVKEGVTTVAEADDSPVVTISKLGDGTIVYYGYRFDKETFSTDNTFPVFWRRLIDLMTNRPSLTNLNIRTGSILSFPQEQKVATPTGKITTRTIRAEDAGLYVLSDRTIAANLLSDLESNINREPAIKTTGPADGEKESRTVPKDLGHFFLLAAVIILFLELLYIKLRGDI